MTLSNPKEDDEIVRAKLQGLLPHVCVYIYSDEEFIWSSHCLVSMFWEVFFNYFLAVNEEKVLYVTV